MAVACLLALCLPHAGRAQAVAVPGAADFRQATAGPVNSGAFVTLKTDAQRLTYTPAAGEIVYATDTHLFYTGDGVAVGGAASDCGFTARQLQRLGVIAPRHRRYLSALRFAVSSGSTANIPHVVAIGNSIVQGSGASVAANAWVPVLGAKLQAYTALGTASQWSPVQYGDGGSTVATADSFLADAQAGTYATPTRSTLWNTSPTAVLVMDMRNDPTYTSAADYALLLRVALLQIKRHNADPVLVIEPPEINATTGAVLDNASNWTPYYQAALQAAADEGATVVDAWAFFGLLQRQGVDLRPLMYTDGVHPSDAGHALIASLVFECLTAPPPAPGVGFTDRAATDGRVSAVAGYASAVRSPDTVGTTSANGTTGASTAATARQVQLGQSTSTVYAVPSGGYLLFNSPGPVRGVIVSYYTDSNNTGRPVVSYNSVSPTGAVTTGARWDGYQTNGTSTLQNISGPYSRQFDWYYSTAGQNGTFVDEQAGTLEVLASGGQIAVLGVTWVMGNESEYHPTWGTRTETGAGWSAGTFADNSEPARSDATAGDSVSLPWYGSSLGIDFQTSPSSGEVDVATDGVTVAAQDLYSGGTGRKHVAQVAKNLAEGWHTTTLTVDAAKNASSTGFTVLYGHLAAVTHTPDPSFSYVSLAQGETVSLGDYWKRANIDTVTSGTPAVQFSPGKNTLTLSGTGSAVVRLTR